MINWAPVLIFQTKLIFLTKVVNIRLFNLFQSSIPFNGVKEQNDIQYIK